MSTNPNPNPSPGSETCKNIPNLLSSFVTTFVDFSVSGGIFLPNPTNPNPPPPSPPPLQTHYPAQDRLIAIGDIHGDIKKCEQSLSLAGLIDAAGNWSGAATTVVQIGDVLDRGNDEIKILYFLEKLRRQAENSGGKFITMNGNHELMNIDCDFRYITRKSLDEFKNWAFWYRVGNSMRKLCGENIERDAFYGVPKAFVGIKEEFHEGIRARIAALRPRGPVSTRFFADNVTVLVVGENVFVHGGLLAKHVKYGLERINEEVREWIKGERSVLWKDVDRGRDAVVWLRRFSNEAAESCDCEALEKVLRTIPGAERMVMGHTIQQVGINGACEGKAIRIDVGMSRGCGDGFCEVLEIGKEGGLRVLSSNPGYDEKRGVRSKGRRGLGLLLEEDEEDGRKRVQVRA